MVKLLFILAFALVAAASRAETRLLLEPTRTTFYQGEQIAMNFVLYAPEEQLEIEVVKFPEFRGFWSENVILRQGPVQLLPSIMQSLTFPHPLRSERVLPSRPKDAELARLRRVVVGSYMASSMIGKSDARVVPMKLLVRRRTSLSAPPQEVELVNEMPNLVIKPIPTPPQDAKFIGGVGRFYLKPDANQILYRGEEPSFLRLNLQGEGNFSEINDLPIAFPDFVEVISRRTYLQGSHNFSLKTFEYGIVVRGSGDLVVPEQMFSFFNPESQRFERIQLAEIHLSPAPPTPPEPTPKKEFLPEEHWSYSIDLSESRGFWILNILLGVFFFGTFLHRRTEKIRAAWRAKPRWKLRQALEKATLQRREGNTDAFLKTSYDLASDLLPHTPEPRDVEKVRTAIQTARYSPTKELPISYDEIESTLKKCVNAVR